jgi:cell wall-associated NlpC family hydrolase
MPSPPEPHSVILALQALLVQGVTWQHEGLEPATGLGCYGLVRHGFALAGVPLPPTAEAADGLFRIVAPPYQPFDIALMRFAPTADARHVGLLLAPEWGFHCSWFTNGVARFELRRGIWKRLMQHGLRYKEWLCI